MSSREWRAPAALKRPDTEVWARWIAFFVLTACAVYVYAHRYFELQPLIDQFGLLNVWFWDGQVYAHAGQHVANGINPYLQPDRKILYNTLPFISAPVVAWTLGALYGLLGEYLKPALQIAHVSAVILTPLLLTRLFLGKTLSDAAFGYGLFLGGIGAFGVTTIIAGNFGAVLYLLIFAALAHGLTKKSWFWYHVALIAAVQVKFPYALLWIVPVLVNGWSWREARNSTIAALVAASIIAASAMLDPAYFQDWLNGLSRQVNNGGDLGFTVFGVSRWMMGLNNSSLVPYIAHAAVCAVLLAFLMVERTKGPMKAAALVSFAIMANPRMKEYDVAFATIPVAALLLHGFACIVPARHRAASAIAAVVVTMLVVLKADRLPFLDALVYPITVAAGILSLAIIRPRIRQRYPVVPVRSVGYRPARKSTIRRYEPGERYTAAVR